MFFKCMTNLEKKEACKSMPYVKAVTMIVSSTSQKKGFQNVPFRKMRIWPPSSAYIRFFLQLYPDLDKPRDFKTGCGQGPISKAPVTAYKGSEILASLSCLSKFPE